MDDLDSNQFYNHIQGSCLTLIDAVEAKNGLLLIPKLEEKLSREQLEILTDTHVVIPSPYFRSVYESARVHAGYTVHVEDGTVSTEEGFSNPMKSLVVGEELCYGSRGSYRILLIDSPLVQFNICKVPEQQKTPTLAGLFTSKPEGVSDSNSLFTLEQSIHYIKSACNESTVEMIDQGVQEFSASYLIVPKFLEDCSKKLCDLHSHLLKNIPNTAYKSEVAVENIILTRLHPALFKAICNRCTTEEKALSSLRSLTWTSEDFSISSTPSMTECLAELKSLDRSTTTSEKAAHILSALNSLQASASREREKGCQPLTSDDCIPLMAFALSQFDKSHLLPAHIMHVQLFSWSRGRTDPSSFAAATIQASLQYLQHVAQEKRKKASVVKPKPKQVSRELQKAICKNPLYSARAEENKDYLRDFDLDDVMDGAYGKLS